MTSRRSNIGRMGQMVMGGSREPTGPTMGNSNRNMIQDFKEDQKNTGDLNMNPFKTNTNMGGQINKPFTIKTDYKPSCKTEYKPGTNHEKQLNRELEDLNSKLASKQKSIKTIDKEIEMLKPHVPNNENMLGYPDSTNFNEMQKTNFSQQQAKPFKIKKVEGTKSELIGIPNENMGNYNGSSTTTSYHTNNTGSRNSEGIKGQRINPEMYSNEGQAHHKMSYNFETMPSMKSSVNGDINNNPVKQRNSNQQKDERTQAGAKFLERFKFAINREKEMFSKESNSENTLEVKGKKHSKINEKMQGAMFREKQGNQFEAHEEKVVGVSDMNDNIKFEEVIVENEEMIECPEGCGRSFRQDALDKHVIACKKIFQTKRKEFETNKKRAVNAEQIAQQKKAERKEKMAMPKGKNPAKGKSWKNESNNLQDFIKKKKAETLEKGGPEELPDEVVHVKKTENNIKEVVNITDKGEEIIEEKQEKDQKVENKEKNNKLQKNISYTSTSCQNTNTVLSENKENAAISKDSVIERPSSKNKNIPEKQPEKCSQNIVEKKSPLKGPALSDQRQYLEDKKFEENKNFEKVKKLGNSQKNVVNSNEFAGSQSRSQSPKIEKIPKESKKNKNDKPIELRTNIKKDALWPEVDDNKKEALWPGIDPNENEPSAVNIHLGKKGSKIRTKTPIRKKEEVKKPLDESGGNRNSWDEDIHLPEE